MPTTARQTPFIGRDAELAALSEQLASRGDAGALALIVGEAGIGKTRLLGEFASEARQAGARVLWGRCHEGEGVPSFWPWVQLVRAWAEEFRTDPSRIRATLGEGAPEIVQLVPALRNHVPDVPPPLPLEPAQARFRLFDSLTLLFRQMARDVPLVLLLDDLHWTDQSSLRLLQFMAGELQGDAILVVGAYRGDEVSPEHPLAGTLAALRRLPGCRAIALRGLPTADVADVVEALLPADAAWNAGRLAAEIHRETGGNPFFIEELVRHLMDSGQLGAADPDGGHGAALPAMLGLPDGARAVIAGRIARLTSACQQCLAVASVLGREFQADLLTAVLERTPERVLANLQEATVAGLTARLPDRPHGYSFAHDLIREALYRSLPPGRCERLHRRVAEHMERRYGPAGERVAEIADHFLRSGPGGGAARAAGWAERAAAAARAALAYEDAAGFYERLLTLADLDPAFPRQQRAAVSLALAEVQHAAGNRELARQRCLQAAAEARLLDPPAAADLLARAALAFGRDIDIMGVSDRLLIALLEESRGRLDRGDSPLHARVLARLGEAYRFSEIERGTALCREAVEIARRLADPPTLLFCLCALRYLLGHPTQLAARLALSAEIVVLADAVGETEPALLGYRWRIADLVGAGDIAAADVALDGYEQRSAALRQPYYRWWGAILRTMRAWFNAPVPEIERQAAAALALGRQAQQPDAPAFFLMQLLLPRLEQGRFAELIEPLRAAADRYTIYRLCLAWVYAELGRLDEAKGDFLLLVRDDCAGVPRDGNWLSSIALLGVISAHLDDREHARGLYALLRPYAGSTIVSSNGMLCVGSSDRALGLLAATAGDLAAARAHFEAAIHHNTRLMFLSGVVYTQHDFAWMLLRHGEPGGRDRDRIRTLLEEAIVGAGALAFDHHAASARAMLRQLNSAQRAGPAPAALDLPARPGPLPPQPPARRLPPARPRSRPPPPAASGTA